MSVHGELELQRTNGVALEQKPPAEVSIVQIIEKISQMPNLSMDQVLVIKELVALRNQEREQERKERFFEALARVQAKAPRIARNGIMDRGPGKGTIPYAKREDIDAVMRPLYQAEGFSVTWNFPRNESLIRVVGKFTAFGHTEEREWSCSPDTSGGKQNPQAAGSTDSYGQRYISIGFWDIITEGADVNGANPKNLTCISQEQADAVSTALEDIGAKAGTPNRAAFYKTFGVSEVSELKLSQIDNVWVRINSRRNA